MMPDRPGQTVADFTSLFWSGFIGGITIMSIVALVAFVWQQSRARKREDGEEPETMGHRWDGDLEEYNNPMPRWWLGLFYLTLFWGAGYLIAYPGLGAFEGVLGWTQLEQYSQEIAEAEERYGALYAQYAGTDLAVLAEDEEALDMGRNLFSSYCTQCHGADAGGARGFPDLTDNDWQWGDSPAAIKASIVAGRQGVMPPWGAMLSAAEIEQVADFVEQLAGRSPAGSAAEAGATKYQQLCAACHGADGAGNIALGAPRLSDDVWLYGGSRKQIVTSIRDGRNGVMPAHKNFLGPDKAHVLAAYVYSFTRGNSPTR